MSNRSTKILIVVISSFYKYGLFSFSVFSTVNFFDLFRKQVFKMDLIRHRKILGISAYCNIIEITHLSVYIVFVLVCIVA